MSLWIVMTIRGLVAVSDGPLETGYGTCEAIAAARRMEVIPLFRDGEPMHLGGMSYGREDINIFCIYQQRRPRPSVDFHQ